MKRLSKDELVERVRSDSPYARAAAAWVATHNRNTFDWVDQYPESPLLDPDFVTDVTFKIVGDYYYSEMTYDHGHAGISYTFWEPYTVAKGKNKGEVRYRPITDMEIAMYDGMNAGKFIEECVALLEEESQ